MGFLLIFAKWIAGDAVWVRSKRALGALSLVSVLALVYAATCGWPMVKPLVRAKPPRTLPPDAGDVRFGVPLALRKEIFDEFAAAEPEGRAEGIKSFSGPALAWSAEDHRGAIERQRAAQIAARHRLSLTQVYLCLDEGIRAHWPGADGAPLEPHTVPLNPRRKYGF